MSIDIVVPSPVEIDMTGEDVQVTLEQPVLVIDMPVGAPGLTGVRSDDVNWIVVLTQLEYDLLPTKDPATVYYIREP